MYWECTYWDPDGFDPWISLVRSLILNLILRISLVYSLIMMGMTLGISWISLVHFLILGSILGISLIPLGISLIFLILGSILGISLFMGTTLGISWSYDIFSIWSRCIFDLKSFNCSFLDHH